MFFMRSRPSAVTFQVDLNSNMAALTSDWLTHFELFLKNGWRDLFQTCHKCSLWGPDQVLLLFKSIWNPIWPPRPLIGWHILNFSRMAEGIYSKFANTFLMRSYNYMLLHGSDQVLLLFKLIRNIIWPPWPLIGWHIFELLLKNGWRDLLQTCHKFFLWDPITTCCYYWNRSKSIVAAMDSDWLTYKKLIMSFCFKFLSGVYNSIFLITTRVSDTGPLGLLLYQFFSMTRYLENIIRWFV